MKWDELSMAQKSELMGIYVRNGVTSLDDMRNHFNSFATGGGTNPDWDPDNPYHYHTTNGEKVVINPEDWEKHKGQPYFKQVEDAVLAEQAVHPGPEYIINPKFSEDLRSVYKGNMGPKYQNYSSFSGNLPQGYNFTPEGLVQDNQGNLYVQKGFRQTPRFTYDENNPLVFPVLEGRNQGNVTFYPINMEKIIKPSLPVSSIMNVDKEHESAIKKAQNQYEYIVTPWNILPNSEGGFWGYGDDYEKHQLWTDVYDDNFRREVSNYLSNLFNRPIELNQTDPEDTKITITPKEFELVKKELKDSYNEDNRRRIENDKEWYNKYKDLHLNDTPEEQAEYKRVHDEYQQSLLDWINQPNPWARYLMDGSLEDQSPKPRKISRKEAEKKAVIEIGPLQVDKIETFGNGGYLFATGGPKKTYKEWVTQMHAKYPWLELNSQKAGYDYERYFNENYDDAVARLTEAEARHFTDKYKLPNHPTFSNESIYSQGPRYGGTWTNDDRFTPSVINVQQHPTIYKEYRPYTEEEIYKR